MKYLLVMVITIALLFLFSGVLVIDATNDNDNPPTSTLLGISILPPTQFGWIDVETGRIKAPLLFFTDDYVFQQGLGSWDKQTCLYYTIAQRLGTAWTGMLALDPFRQTVARNITLPFASQGVLGYGHYISVDSLTGNVLVVGRSIWQRDQNQHVLLSIHSDDSVSVLTKMGDVNTQGELLPGAVTLDTNQRLLWCLGNWDESYAKLIAYNIDNGARIATITDYPAIISMAFDNRTADLFGIGIRDDPMQPVPQIMISLIRVQTAMHLHHELSLKDFPTYYDILLGIGALDSTERILYALLKLTPGTMQENVSSKRRLVSYQSIATYKYNVEDDADYVLVGIDVDTATLVYQANTPCGYSCPGSFVSIF